MYTLECTIQPRWLWVCFGLHPKEVVTRSAGEILLSFIRKHTKRNLKTITVVVADHYLVLCNSMLSYHTVSLGWVGCRRKKVSCGQRWPWTLDPPASSSLVLRLQDFGSTTASSHWFSKAAWWPFERFMNTVVTNRFPSPQWKKSRKGWFWSFG